MFDNEPNLIISLNYSFDWSVRCVTDCTTVMNVDQMTSSRALLCPHAKDIQFVVTERYGSQEIYLHSRGWNRSRELLSDFSLQL